MKNNFKFLLILMVSFYSWTLKGQCTDPSNLAYSYSNSVSTFSWDAVPNALSYEIEFKYPGAIYSWAYPEYTTTSNTNSLVIPNIPGSHSYEYRVKAVCSSTMASNFVASQFTVPCVAPTNLSLVSATSNSVTLSWTEELGLLQTNSYRVSYRVLNSGAPWTLAGSGYFNTITINNLAPGTTYEWCVNTTCGYFWSDPVTSQFSTIPLDPCVSPSNLNASNITTNSALLTWNAVTGATGYVLQYSFNNAWVSVNVSATSFPLTGLNNNTQYAFRVLTLCAGGSQSALSSNFIFTTSNMSACNNVSITNLQVVASANNGALVTWDALPLVTGYVVEYKLATASSWTVFPTVYLNSFTTNNLLLSSNYNFRVKAFCTNNSTAYSTANFTTASAPLPQTCLSSGVNSVEFIDLFKLGSINRVSGADAGGYVNTGLSTNLAIGTIHPFQFSAGFTAGSRLQNYAVYIDFNRNGNFNDVGERVFGVGMAANGSILNANITVPSTATPGPAALRVIMVRRGTNVSPCLNSFFGEVEDYSVNLISVSNKTQDQSIDDQILNTSAVLNKATNLFVYPNPSNGLFTLVLPEDTKYSRYEVISMDGKVIDQQTITDHQPLSINLKDQISGMYLLHVLDDKGNRTFCKLFCE